MAENFNGFDALTMTELWAIASLPIKLVWIIRWLDEVYMPLRERTRRLISHFGVVRLLHCRHVITQVSGVDFTNCIYAIVWHLLLLEAPPSLYVQNITRPVSCGNMLESLMAIAFFGPQNIGDVEQWLRTERWATHADVAEAATFLREINHFGWQEGIAESIPLLERLIVLVHRVCRVRNPFDIFGRLNNNDLDRALLNHYVADLEAMRLGWPSAAYAQPGLARPRGYDADRWVIFRHPGLSDARVVSLMFAGRE